MKCQRCSQDLLRDDMFSPRPHECADGIIEALGGSPGAFYKRFAETHPWAQEFARSIEQGDGYEPDRGFRIAGYTEHGEPMFDISRECDFIDQKKDSKNDR